MTTDAALTERTGLDRVTRLIHLGLTVCGILAWLTGLMAGDYKTPRHFWFGIHQWLGMGLSFFMAWRVWYGLTGPPEVQFRQWVPCTQERLLLVWEDIRTLLQLRLPDRPPRQGLAGLVQTFGLAAFSWMAATGSLMFLFLEPGRKARGVLHAVKELHEVGWWLVLIFLAIHGGAVILHALAGQDLWRPMFFLAKNSEK